MTRVITDNHVLRSCDTRVFIAVGQIRRKSSKGPSLFWTNAPCQTDQAKDLAGIRDKKDDFFVEFSYENCLVSTF